VAETVGIGAEGLGVLMAAQHHEDLGAVGAAVVAGDVAALALEERRLVREHPAPVVQATRMEHADIQP